MALNPDFRDLFASLNGAGAEYLVIGAYALAVHGAPRFTKDLDLWVRPSEENAKRVWSALEVFGAPMGNLKIKDLSSPGIVFQIGIAPNRIDLLTTPDGVDFDTAWGQRVESRYGDQSIHILGKADLIQNKQATGRTQDLADIEALRKMEG